MSLVQQVAERVCVLDYGRKLAEGSPAEALNDPAVLQAYLGSAGGAGAGETAVDEMKENVDAPC